MFRCSISGYHTFTIATKVGTSPTGTPRPDAKQMHEETDTSQRNALAGGGLFAPIRSDAAGFRMIAVSYDNRDLDSGAGQVDPNNPNLLPNGAARTTSGLLQTKAAIQFVEAQYPTTKLFLHGGSVGSAGTY